MEANKTNSKTLSESTKIAEKLFNGTAETLMDMYTKQLNMYANFYTHLFNPLAGNKNRGGEGNFFNMFFNNNSMKPFWGFPANFNGFNFSNPFQVPFEGIYKQMIDYNRNLLVSFNNELKKNQEEGVAISKEYEETIEKRLDVSRKITEAIMAAYSKQMEFAIENNNKMVAEISGQFNDLIKQNQKLWTDMFITYTLPKAGKEKKTVQEHEFNGNKRKASLATIE